MYKAAVKLSGMVTIIMLLAGSIIVLAPSRVSAFEGGDGLEETPYRIGDCQDFQDINNDRDAYYVLANDVDCSDTANWNSGEGFVPIGDGMIPFTGELDGQDYSVTGIYINRELSTGVGIFGSIGSGDNQVGLVKNTYFGDIDVTGNYSTGGVVGILYGQLNRVHASGEVVGFSEVGGLVGSHGGIFDTIINSRSDVNVTGSGIVIGGLVGYNADDSQITNSYATGNVTGLSTDASRAGGLVGHNLGDIQSSHATGNVTSEGYRVGGLVGRNGGNITRSYATGSVRSDLNVVGGLVGYNAGGSIVQSYSDNTNNPESNFGVIGSCDVGGLVGSNSGASIQDSFSRSSVTTTLACSVGGLVGVSVESSVSYAYSTGQVSGGLDSYGGFGGAFDATDEIRYSFFDTQTTQQSNACGALSGYDCDEPGRAIGKTTAQMHDIDTFTTELTENSWDFETTWDIDAGINDNYPYFIISGAEELNLEPSGSSAGTQIIEPDGDSTKPILVEQLEGTEICNEFEDATFARTEPQLATQDPDYDYSSHLVGFTLSDCEVGGTTTMRLIFTGEFDAQNTVLRKYNSQTQEFATITPLSIEETTLNDLPALDVRYELTDGGVLDEDGQANGTIVDPVGLALLASEQSSGSSELASSGSNAAMLVILSLGLVGGSTLIVARNRLSNRIL